MLSFPLLRFLFGYLRFRAWGGFAARFLNLLEQKGLRVWDLQRTESGVFAFVAVKDYRQLRVVAKNAGMRLQCLEKHGLPFLWRARRQRVGLLIGAGICAVLALVLTQFLWSVETVGASAVSDIEILDAASQIGLYPGAPKPKKNGEDLAIELRALFGDRLSWAAVNIIGSRVQIEVRDAEPQPEQDPPYGDPCDLVADFDGQLLSIEVHAGEKANEVGNGVKKGDLLISGAREDRFGNWFYYEARGIVTALHEKSESRSSQPSLPVRRIHAVRTVPVLHLWHLSLPLFLFPKGGDYTEGARTHYLTLHGVTLPLGLTTRTRYYFMDDDQNAMPLLFDDFTFDVFASCSNSLVLSGKITVRETEDAVTVTQKSRLIDFMGKPHKLTKKESEETQRAAD